MPERQPLRGQLPQLPHPLRVLRQLR